MDPRGHLKMGLEGLSVHRLRSLLTMLGIIFGVAAVIAMLSIGEGAKRAALEKFEALGVNNIIIRDKDLSDKDLEEVRAKFSKGLTIKDAEAIRMIVPTVVTVSAVPPYRAKKSLPRSLPGRRSTKRSRYSAGLMLHRWPP